MGKILDEDLIYRQEKWLPTGRLHVSSAGIKIRGL